MEGKGEAAGEGVIEHFGDVWIDPGNCGCIHWSDTIAGGRRRGVEVWSLEFGVWSLEFKGEELSGLRSKV